MSPIHGQRGDHSIHCHLNTSTQPPLDTALADNPDLLSLLAGRNTELLGRNLLQIAEKQLHPLYEDPQTARGDA